MLVIHQAVAVPSMQHILLSSMQLWDNNVRVNDEPKYLAPNPSQEHHSIIIPEANDVPALCIPLRINGVTSYFPTRRPTKEEYKKCTLQLELTAESPEWDPQSMRFREQEDAMLDTRGNIRKENIQNRNDKIIATVGTNTPTSSDQMITEDQQLATALVAAVHISSGTISVVKTGKRKCVIGPHTLAKHWGIGLDAARRTVEATTQKGVRTILHPTLSRRFRTNDRQLQYRRLSHDMFTDTLEACTRSWFRRNKYAQVFSTKFGWVRVYPMQRKSLVHEALIQFPPEMVENWWRYGGELVTK